jgi:hypothetical protein
MARQSTFWASVNSSEFLVDSEGNRRFMVIPLTSIRRLSQDEVDAIWLAALTAYESGEIWWLNEVEQELQRRENKGFEENDIWTQIIENYCEGRDKVTVTEILQNAIQMDCERHGRRESDRVIKVLKQLGWTRQQVRQGSERGKYFWVNGIQESSSKNINSNLYSTQNLVPEPVSDNMESRNIAFQEKNSKLSKKVEIGNGLNPPLSVDGNPPTPPTSLSTENRFFQKTGGAVFHGESETAENQSQSGIEPIEKWNIAKIQKKGEMTENQSQSGIEPIEKWNIAQNSYIPPTSLLDGIETRELSTHWAAKKGNTVGVGCTEKDAIDDLMARL